MAPQPTKILFNFVYIRTVVVLYLFNNINIIYGEIMAVDLYFANYKLGTYFLQLLCRSYGSRRDGVKSLNSIFLIIKV